MIESLVQLGQFIAQVRVQIMKQSCDFILFLIEYVSPALHLHNEYEAPKRIFLVRYVGEKQCGDKIHALAVTNLRIISRVSSQYVVKPVAA